MSAEHHVYDIVIKAKRMAAFGAIIETFDQDERLEVIMALVDRDIIPAHAGDILIGQYCAEAAG